MSTNIAPTYHVAGGTRQDSRIYVLRQEGDEARAVSFDTPDDAEVAGRLLIEQAEKARAFAAELAAFKIEWAERRAMERQQEWQANKDRLLPLATASAPSEATV